MPANTWEVTASGNYYHGPGTGGLNLPPGQATAFRFIGSGAPGNTDNIGMSIDISTTGILDTIPYSLSTYGNGFHIAAMDTAKSFPDSYLINAYASDSYPSALMTLHIRSMLPLITDDTYKTVVYGTFDGTAVDLWHQNHVVPITKGRFKAIY